MEALEEIFDTQLFFYQVPFNVEFVYDGAVYCKTAPDYGTKVNCPHAGNICRFDSLASVRVSSIDCPAAHLTDDEAVGDDICDNCYAAGVSISQTLRPFFCRLRLSFHHRFHHLHRVFSVSGFVRIDPTSSSSSIPHSSF